MARSRCSRSSLSSLWRSCASLHPLWTVRSLRLFRRRMHNLLRRLELHRIVVKLGTNVIMRQDGRVALGLLCGLVEQVAELRAQGIEVLVVSSGAVGLGMER